MFGSAPSFGKNGAGGGGVFGGGSSFGGGGSVFGSGGNTAGSGSVFGGGGSASGGSVFGGNTNSSGSTFGNSTEGVSLFGGGNGNNNNTSFGGNNSFSTGGAQVSAFGNAGGTSTFGNTGNGTSVFGGGSTFGASGVSNSSGSETQTFKVPADKMGLVVGKKGSTIKKIQAQHQVQVDTSDKQADHQNMQTVTIKGSGVDGAWADIQRLIGNTGVAGSTSSANSGGSAFGASNNVFGGNNASTFGGNAGTSNAYGVNNTPSAFASPTQNSACQLCGHVSTTAAGQQPGGFASQSSTTTSGFLGTNTSGFQSGSAAPVAQNLFGGGSSFNTPISKSGGTGTTFSGFGTTSAPGASTTATAFSNVNTGKNLGAQQGVASSTTFGASGGGGMGMNSFTSAASSAMTSNGFSGGVQKGFAGAEGAIKLDDTVRECLPTIALDALTLSDADKVAYNAAEFTPNNIPLIAPPPELCR